MKAIVQNGYGGPEVIELKDVSEPVPSEGDLLVRVVAVGLNAADRFSMRGSPWIIRFSAGFPRPKDHILGLDVAGHVEAVGADVTGFKPGDLVFGSCEHALAEYVCAPADRFSPAPVNLPPEQAAAVPTAALAALEALRDVAKVRPGQEVLINGASGGVGTFAVQIARVLGATVTGVCSTGSLETVRSIGADRVIDYTKEDFTRGGERYDVILDNAGGHSFADCRRALAPGGIHVPNTGHRGMGYVARAFAISAFMKRHASPFMSIPTTRNLMQIKELVESGDVRPVIDRTWPMSDTREALRHLEEEHVRGKVVVTVAPRNS